MDTESLRLFVLAAEKLNISAAGRALGLAPAVSSARLAKLENDVRAELLRRSTRKVSLSLEGEEFLPFAREILAQEEAGRAALGAGKPSAHGTLRFAAPSSFAQLYILPILPGFMKQHPGLKMDLRLSDTRFDLIEGSFDLALRSAPMADTSLKGRKLADDIRILCASPDYLERKGIPETPDSLKEHDLIAFQDQSPRPLKSNNGVPGVFDPRPSRCRLVVDDGTSQKIATLAGSGISINSIWAVHDELKKGSLVRVLPDFIADDRAILWLVYPKSNVLTPKVRLFIDYLRTQIGASPSWTIS